MDFEKKVPNWSAEGTEPSESLKTSGFQGGYRPPAAIFNWFWHSVSACLQELQENLSNVNNTADTEKYVKFAQEALAARGLQNAMTVRLNGGRTEGTDQFTFDGSTARTVNITPDKIGAAEADLSNVDATVLAAAIAAAGGGGIPVVTADTSDFTNYTSAISSITELSTGIIITVIPVAENIFSGSPTLNVNGSGAKPIMMLGCDNTGDLLKPGAGFLSYACPVTLRYLAEYQDGCWVVMGQQKAAAKSSTEALVIPSSAWTGEGPYTAEVDCTIATASNNLVVGAGGTLTAEQQEAMSAAMIVCTAQAAGSVTLTAFGEAPTIDLPVNVLEVG